MKDILRFISHMITFLPILIIWLFYKYPREDSKTSIIIKNITLFVLLLPILYVWFTMSIADRIMPMFVNYPGEDVPLKYMYIIGFNMILNIIILVGLYLLYFIINSIIILTHKVTSNDIRIENIEQKELSNDE